MTLIQTSSVSTNDIVAGNYNMAFGCPNHCLDACTCTGNNEC